MKNTKIYQSEFEHGMSYEKDGEHRELILVHMPGTEPKKVVSAIYSQEQNTNGEPLQLIELSPEEVRARYDFMTELINAGLLG